MSRRVSLPPNLAQRLRRVLLLLLVTAFVSTLLFVRGSVRNELSAQGEQAQRLPLLASAALDLIATGDQVAADTRVRELMQGLPFTSIELIDDRRQMLLQHTIAQTESLSLLVQPWLDASEISVSVPAMLRTGRRANLVVGLSAQRLNTVARDAALTGLGVAAALMLIMLLAARKLQTQFAWQIQSLATRLREAVRNTAPAAPPAPDEAHYREIGALSQAISESAAVIRHHRQSLDEARDLLEHSENRLTRIVSHMSNALIELDSEGRIRFLNPAWERFTGFSVTDALRKPFANFLVDEEARRDFTPERLPEHTDSSRELAVRTAEGRPLWARLETQSRRDTGGRFTGIVATLSDITHSIEMNRMLRRYQDELYELTVTDPLTGLYNRRHFDTQLEAILAEQLSRGESVCLMLIDLDGFKFINDTYGHPFGDEVLRALSQVLRRQVRRNDYIARLAGNEFAMVLKNTSLDSAPLIARKLHAEIAATRVPLPVGSMMLQTSIGIAEAPTHGRHAQELVSAADVALYHGKRQGRNRIEVLSPDMSRATISIFSKGFQVRNALEQGNMRPAFQPIYDMTSGRELAYEVLARMRVSDTIVQAKDFIAVAEELGLTRELDLSIIRQALALTPTGQALFVNVDLSSFANHEFVTELIATLRPACEAGRSITIEITERETVPVTDGLLDDVQRLRALGCKLALDDFGSGYSTYQFLNQFKPDYIKIEGTFVRTMLESEAAHKIVTHIHGLAQAFGMETIAESVESEAVRRALVEIGIRNVQGRLYGEPVLAA